MLQINGRVNDGAKRYTVVIDHVFSAGIPWGIDPMAERLSISYWWCMKSSTKDKIEGAAHTAKGKAKEVVGKLAGNQKLTDRGTVEKVAGKVQSRVGGVKKVFGK